MGCKRKFIYLFIFLFLIIISIPSLSATDSSLVNNSSINGDLNQSLYSDDNSLADLKDLFDSNINGTIDLDSDYSYKSTDNVDGITISKDITINGNNHVINGGNLSTIFHVSNEGVLTLNNIKISSGNHNYGGAIYNKGILTISNCEFSDNYVDGDGGVIYSYSTLSISDSLFKNNYAGGNAQSNSGGGVLFLDGSNKIFNTSISNCEFYNNTVNGGDGGGAIYNYKSNLYINSSSFYSNIANPVDVYFGGGAIFSKGETKNYINNCNFYNNYVLNDGGAIAVYGNSNLEINNTNIYDNIADSSAGGVYIENSIANLNNVSLNGNKAVLGGGAISIMYTDEISPIVRPVVNIVNSSICNNEVTEDYGGGAGAIMSMGAMVNLNKSNVYNNSAVNYGGAFAIDYGTFTTSYSNIVNNSDENGISTYVVHGTFKANYDWWGSNNDPNNLVTGLYYSPVISNWVIMDFTNSSSPIVVNDKANIKSSLSHYTTTGSDSFILEDTLPSIPVYFTSQEGSFDPSYGLLNEGVMNSVYTSEKNGDNVIYASIDNQTLSIRFNNIQFPKTIINNDSLIAYSDDICVNVITENGRNVTKGVVSIYNGSTLLGEGNVVDGICKISTNLTPNTYNVNVQYNCNDSTYKSSSKDLLLTIKLRETNIIANNLVMYYKDGSYFNVKLMSNNISLSNKEIYITINGVSYKRITNSSGEANILIKLSPNTYNFNVLFNGDLNYQKNDSNYTVTVLPTNEQKLILTANNISMNYMDGTQFAVKLTDGVNTPMVGEKVSLIINGVTYYRTTGTDGVAKLNIRLYPGTYSIDVSFSKENYETVKVTNTVNVKDNSGRDVSVILTPDIVMNYKDGTKFVATLIDSYGNPLVGKTVGFLINTVLYNKITDSTGQAKLNINLNTGIYILGAQFLGDDDYCAAVSNAMVSVKTPGDDRILTSLNSVSTTVTKGTQYEVKLFDENKKALANEVVIITVNGKNYYRTTDNTGTAKLTLNLNYGQYNILAQYMGSSKYVNSPSLVKLVNVV